MNTTKQQIIPLLILVITPLASAYLFLYVDGADPPGATVALDPDTYWIGVYSDNGGLWGPNQTYVAYISVMGADYWTGGYHVYIPPAKLNSSAAYLEPTGSEFIWEMHNGLSPFHSSSAGVHFDFELTFDGTPILVTLYAEDGSTVIDTLQIINTGPIDTDEDGISDDSDNCPTVSNPSQTDADEDGVGDACDICPGGDDRVDTDGDSVPDDCDNCPNNYNPTQTDSDGDGIGNDCDNCSTNYNPGQVDDDNDGFGNVCDICPGGDDTVDTDGDSVPDDCDNCPQTPNPGQEDTDGDSTGDVCEQVNLAFGKAAAVLTRSGWQYDPDPNDPYWIPLLYNSPSLIVDGDWKTQFTDNDPCSFAVLIDLGAECTIYQVTLVGTSDINNSKALSRFSSLEVLIVAGDGTINERTEYLMPAWVVGSQPTVTINFTGPNNIGRYIKVYRDSPGPWGGTDFDYTNSIDAAGETYDYRLTLAEVEVYGPATTVTTAHAPDPYDAETDVPTDTDLSWQPPVSYQTDYYELYLDTNESMVIESDSMCMQVVATWSETYTPTIFLALETKYYWKVIAYEPNEPSAPIPHEGPVWSFTTQKAVQVDAGPNIITWLDGGMASVNLNGTVTCYLSGPDSILWSVVEPPANPNVTIVNDSVEDTTASIYTSGTFLLSLWANDNETPANEDEDTMEIQVFAGACEAAKANPNGYTPLPHDSNGDCREDLADFISFAMDWLKDLSLTENLILE